MTSSYSLCYILLIFSSKYVFGSESSLTFVIDDTASMHDDIDAVRKATIDIFNIVQGDKKSQIENVVLVTFNDRSTTPVCFDRGQLRAKTKDRNTFLAALASIRVSSVPYDCWECSMAGIKLGLDESLPRSSIYVFTDATSKDYQRFEEIKRLALDKQCQIVFVLTGLCREPTTSPRYKVYQDVADATQGQIFHIDKNEVNKVLDYVKKTITGRIDTKIKTTLSPGSHSLTFDADALTGEVLFSLASDTSNSPTVNIKGPDGSDVYKKVVFDTDKAKVYAFNAEKPGKHIVQVYSTTEARAVVSAVSGIDFEHGFASVKHDSLLETRATPAPGAKSHLFIRLNEGDIELKAVKLLDINNKVIMELPLEISKSATKFYTTPKFEPPHTMFKIAIIGYHAESKSNITRMVPTFVEYPKSLPGETITPKRPSVIIEGEAKVNANYDEPLELTCKVEGYPKPNIVWKNIEKGTVYSTETLPGAKLHYDHISILSIEKVKENGTYSCEANNDHGADSKQVTLEVIRKRYFKFTNIPENITVEYKKEAKMFCKVDAYPPAEITWYKNEKIIMPDINVEIQVSHNDSVVTIKKSTLADEGKYSCEAKYEDTKQSIDQYVTIVGLEPPVIDKNVTNVNVSKGLSTTIECKILKGMPKPSISWTFVTTSKISSTIEKWKNQEQIVISNADTVNTGVYQCYAENDASSDQHEVHLVVEYGPIITKINEKEELTVKTGSKTSISCDVDGVPPPHVTWLKNDVEITNTTKIHMFDNHTISLVADLSDAGDYLCMATNKLATDKKSVKLYVTVPATISTSSKQRNKTLEVGYKRLSLMCKASGVPEPEIKWIYQNFDASVPSREMLESKGNTLLQLENIQIKHEGNYTCNASNSAGFSTVTYSVHVVEKPIFDRSSNSEISVEIGLSTKLECKLLKGRPKPSITWSFRLGAGDKDSPEIFKEIPEWRDKESVVVEKVEKNNSGTYQCQAENVVSREYRELTVIVEYPPIILNQGFFEKFLKAVVGSEVSIPCDVDGRPPPEVSWLKDGVELVNDGKPYTFGVHVLKFNAQLAHKGSYTCNATNKLGSDSKTVRMDVTEPANIIKPKITSYAVPVGSEVTLLCESKGDPEPVIKWTYQKFSARTPSNKILRYEKDNSLVIKRIQISQEGNYTCTAINTGGSQNITYEIQVFAPAAIVNTYKEKRFVVVEGDLALQIHCNTTGNPIPTITWTKNGSNLTLGSTYIVEEGILFILNIPKDASGFYKCEVQNPKATDEVTYEVIVKTYPPVDPAPSTIYIENNKTEEIKCQLPHKNTDMLRWFKDEKLIYTGELLLIKALVRDSGYYSCRVSTTTKSYSKGVEVFVGYKPEFLTIEIEQIYITDSLSLSLNCESDGRPDGLVTWYHDGNKLDVNDDIYYFPTGISSPGEYRCEVTNTFGNISRTFKANTRACVIQPSTLANNQAPLLLDSHLSWLAFKKSKDNIVISNGTQVIFFCPSGFEEFPNDHIVAFCNGGTNFLISGDEFDYSDIKCTEEVEHIPIRTGEICMLGDDGENTEKVNIGYKIMNDVVIVVYEVCLNKITEASIYAKHTMLSSLADDEDDTPWSDNDQFQMDYDEAYDCENQIESIKHLLSTFFHNEDGCCFFKRQLVNPKDVFPGVAQKSTYSYFNAVPHWGTCNKQNWNDLEKRVRKLTQNLDINLSVWTGVAQELSLQQKPGRKTNIFISDYNSNQQQVPLYLWKVIQDPVSQSSLAIIQVNVPDLRPADVYKYIRCDDLCDRIAWINNDNWHDVEKGYTYCCELTQFENAFGFNGIFEPDMNNLPKYDLYYD